MTTLPEEAVKAMPERIYAKVHGASTDVISGQRGLIGGWNEHQRDGQAEYVRVDLYAALEAQLAEAREAMEPFAMVAEHDISEDEADSDAFRPMPKPFNHAPQITVGHLRAALRALEGVNEDV